VRTYFLRATAGALGLLFLVPAIHAAEGRGVAEHVVVVVWDGMRPDFITPQYTPTLYELAQKGSFFLHHHSAFISSTEVNGTALATGMHPEHSGVMANTQYRSDLNWLSSYGTESLDAAMQRPKASISKRRPLPK
jgi:predicted AlkP superfamily pyrophosphatase or phosphodiesterase